MTPLEGLIIMSWYVGGAIVLLLAAWLIAEAWEIIRTVIRTRVNVMRRIGVKK